MNMWESYKDVATLLISYLFDLLRHALVNNFGFHKWMWSNLLDARNDKDPTPKLLPKTGLAEDWSLV